MEPMSQRDAATRSAESVLDPFLVSVLSARVSSIVREMSATLVRTSRSAIIKNSRDFSCSILTYDHRLLTVEDCIPVHIAGMNLATEAITEFFDDIKPGDAFLNNCPFTGNTHHADFTLCVPVYIDGEPIFWSLSRAQHADMGAPLPTAYLPKAATLFEEGIHLPCIRIQEDGEDKPDLIRMIKMRNRVPEFWHGDYLAQVAACRVGERRLQALTNRYGVKIIKAFVEEWLAYGERRMVNEIAKLPSGTWTAETRHDPIPDVAPDGIPVHVQVSIDSQEALITVDLRDNVECLPNGMNLTEATALASARIGVFNCLDPSLPHNEGSASRIRVLLRDGCALGIPIHPVGTSLATTNLTGRLINAVAACFAEAADGLGMAGLAYSQTTGEAVISGIDQRRGRIPYVNQLFVGYGGGGAVAGNDGWLLSGAGCDGGQMAVDSVEIDESMYPLMVEERRIAVDSGGAGQWEGAPGISGVIRPLDGELSVSWGSDGDVDPPAGVRGGHAAARSGNWIRRKSGQIEPLPSWGEVVLGTDEAVVFHPCGGGGYGDPSDRTEEAVVASVARGWTSPQRARDVYGITAAGGSDEPGLPHSGLAGQS